jgi:hypothetical protein
MLYVLRAACTCCVFACFCVLRLLYVLRCVLHVAACCISCGRCGGCVLRCTCCVLHVLQCCVLRAAMLHVSVIGASVLCSLRWRVMHRAAGLWIWTRDLDWIPRGLLDYRPGPWTTGLLDSWTMDCTGLPGLHRLQTMSLPDYRPELQAKEPWLPGL